MNNSFFLSKKYDESHHIHMTKASSQILWCEQFSCIFIAPVSESHQRGDESLALYANDTTPRAQVSPCASFCVSFFTSCRAPCGRLQLYHAHVPRGALTNLGPRAHRPTLAKSLHGRPAAGWRRVEGGRRERRAPPAQTDRGRCTWPVLRAETGRGALLRPPMERGTASMGGASQTLLRPSEGAAGRRTRRMRCADGRH